MIDLQNNVLTVKTVESDYDKSVVVSLDLDKIKPEACDHFLNLKPIKDAGGKDDDDVEKNPGDLDQDMDFVEMAVESYAQDVTSSSDTASANGELWDFIDSDEFDMVEQYSFLWENFADETVSTTATASSTSANSATTTTTTTTTTNYNHSNNSNNHNHHSPAAAPTTVIVGTVTSATPSDEDTITSSTKPFEENAPQQPAPSSPSASPSASSPPHSSSTSSPGKVIFSVDCPPDDVGAFFGHPLTRATSALNGEDASAVALLHEYINLPTIEIKEEPKDEVRLDGYLNIISGPKPDPSLSHLEHGDESCNSLHANTSSPEPSLHGDLHREVVLEEGVVVASNSGEVMVMPEYINMFLQEDFRLEKFLIDGQADRHTDSSSTTAGCDQTGIEIVTTVEERQEDSDNVVTSASAKAKKPVRKQNSHTVSRRVTETKRAPRKSRSKTDVTTHVTSTTNGVHRILTKCPATIVSHPPTSTELVSTNFKDDSVSEGAVLNEVIAPPSSSSINNTSVLVSASSIQSHNINNSGTFNTATFSPESPVVVIHSSAPPPSHLHHQQQPQQQQQIRLQQQQQQQQQSQHPNHQSIQQHHLSQIDRQKQTPHQVIVTSVPNVHNGDTKPTQVFISSVNTTTNNNNNISNSSRNATTNHQQVSTKPQPPSRSFSLGAVSNSSKDVGNDTFAQLVKENSLLKKALSEKIRSRQAEENNMPSHVTQQPQFLADDVSIMNLDIKYPPVKQEDAYPGFETQYTYDPVTMTTCGDGLHFNNSIDTSFLHQSHHCNPLQQPQHHNHHPLPPHCNHNGNISNNNHAITTNAINTTSNNVSPCLNDSMIVNSQGQCFQVLQPLQPLESNVQQVPQPPPPPRPQPQPQHLTNTTTHNNNNLSSNNSVNSDANNTYFNYVYQRGLTPQLMETDKQVVVERYLQQQHHYTYANNTITSSSNNNNNNNNNNNTNGYVHFLNDSNYSMKSPDSGFHDTCPSPNAGTKVIPSHLPDPVNNPLTCGVICEADASKDKPKKKKPSSAFPSSGAEKVSTRTCNVKKLEVNTTGYTYVLEAPISTTQRRDEDRVTYLNKSQYYGLTFNFSNQERVLKCSYVKSVIMLVFREERPMDEERRAWEFWHSRQHSYKQRILDIDTKNCQGVVPQNIEEIAFNAVAVKWNPHEGPVRVNIAVHCLSTDFSNQKGVKGIPLHVQIDTYEHSLTGTQVIHRGFCQIKAFCDKGAERKTRDEERRRAAKVKPGDPTPPVIGVPAPTKSRKKTEDAFHEPCEKSEFYSMADILTPPVFFNPTQDNSEYVHKSLVVGVVPAQEDEISSLPSCVDLPDSCDDLFCSPAKRPRRDSNGSQQNFPKVLLYVRERHETAYTALMLEVPTLYGLLKSIEEKYSIQPSKMKNVYKKSKKGILVKLDDNIIRHYSNESTFIIEMNQLNEEKDHEIILTEIDPVAV